jgi:cell division protein FtsB
MTLKPQLSHKCSLYACAVLLLLLLFYAVIGDRGAIHLWRLQGEKAKLDEQNYRLQKENQALREKITRLRSDDLYLEKIAREELNMARPGEVIYRFQLPPAADGRARLSNVPGSGSRRSAVRKPPR